LQDSINFHVGKNVIKNPKRYPANQVKFPKVASMKNRLLSFGDLWRRNSLIRRFCYLFPNNSLTKVRLYKKI